MVCGLSENCYSDMRHRSIVFRLLWWVNNGDKRKWYSVTVCIGCSFCRLIRHWCRPANWRSFIRWWPDQWVSQRYAIDCDRSFYFAVLCLYDSLSQYPISLRAENPLRVMSFFFFRRSISLHKSIGCFVWISREVYNSANKSERKFWRKISWSLISPQAKTKKISVYIFSRIL
jgi:hypothetical protein